MLFGGRRLSDHPRATVKSIDASEALQWRVSTALSPPRIFLATRYVGLIEKDWPIMIAEGDVTRCTGDVIAASWPIRNG